MLNMLTRLLQDGSNLKPIMGRRVGAFFLVDDGRHNAACMRVGRECLAGTRHVTAIAGLVAQLREERGLDWKPFLTAIPPPKSADTDQPLDAATVADRSQVVRIPTLVECYERCMRRVRAMNSANLKIDYDVLAADFRETRATIAGWVNLSKMPREVRDLVLVGNAEGRKVPLTSALEYKGLPDDILIAKVQAMLEQGDTRVATAKATAKAEHDKIRERQDRVQGEFVATKGPRGADEGPAEKPSHGEEKPPREEREEKPEAPRGALVRAPWRTRDLKRFVDEGTDPADRSTTEWSIFAATAKLFVEGPDKITKADLLALGELGRALDAFINPGSPKLPKPRAAKK